MKREQHNGERRPCAGSGGMIGKCKNPATVGQYCETCADELRLGGLDPYQVKADTEKGKRS